MALFMRLVRTLDKLPVVEARAEMPPNGLRMLGAIILPELVIREAEGLWEQPAFTMVLSEKGV